MAEDLKLNVTFGKLSNHLYSFLPGSGAPVTFETIAKEIISVQAFLSNNYWIGGSKLPAINNLLEKVYKNESKDVFSKMICRIVQESIKYRNVKSNPLAKEEVQELNNLLGKIDIEVPELKNLKFLRSLPSNKITSGQKYNTSNISLSWDNLHPLLIEKTKNLFVDGHYSQSIFEACKVIENYVRDISGCSDSSGKQLMSKAFNEDNPIIKLNALKTESDRNEQEGFKFILMGIMVGIRNPKAHSSVELNDPIRAFKYLSFISLVIERIEESKS